MHQRYILVHCFKIKSWFILDKNGPEICLSISTSKLICQKSANVIAIERSVFLDKNLKLTTTKFSRIGKILKILSSRKCHFSKKFQHMGCWKAIFVA